MPCSAILDNPLPALLPRTLIDCAPGVGIRLIKPADIARPQLISSLPSIFCAARLPAIPEPIAPAVYPSKIPMGPKTPPAAAPAYLPAVLTATSVPRPCTILPAPGPVGSEIGVPLFSIGLLVSAVPPPSSALWVRLF
jgi:hypothetical protein